MRIRRVVYFRARGNKLMGFVNAVRCSHIACMGQRYKNEEYTGQIYATDLEKLREIASDSSTELFIDGYDGKMFRVLKYKMRYGIVTGFLVFVFFVFFISNVVVKIEIDGNKCVSDGQILSALGEMGIQKGRFIPTIDLARCEQRIKLLLNNTGWAAIRSQGGRIIVDIHEIDDTPGTIAMNIPCNIISTKDAVIISINTHIGNNVRKAGDAVSKGEILVSGILMNEGNDYESAHALSDIKGEYCEKEVFAAHFSNEKKIYVEKKERKYLDFFGFRFPLFIGTPCSKQADYSEYTSFFSFMNRELPIGVMNAEYKIYEVMSFTDTEEEAAAVIENKIAMYERNFYHDCEVVKKDIKKNKYDDRIEYEVVFTVRGDIGTEKEIFIKK